MLLRREPVTMAFENARKGNYDNQIQCLRRARWCRTAVGFKLLQLVSRFRGLEEISVPENGFLQDHDLQ
jgi:hypothetical protein